MQQQINLIIRWYNLTSPLVQDPNTILNNILRTIKYGLQSTAGIANPNLGPGTDFYISASAITDQISIGNQIIVSQANTLMADTATGSDLDRIMNTYGLARRTASNASGTILITTSIPTFVSTGSQLSSSNGKLYQVVSGGSFANGGSIAIISIDTGSDTNIASGSVMTWISTPPFANSSATVGNAISGGVDAEDDTTARARLLARFASPPQNGNWQNLAEIAEGTDPSIQKAFIYPCANGPATQHLALVKAQETTDYNRDISGTVLTNSTSAILGLVPEFVETVVTTVTNQTYDVSFKVNIPTLPTSGGWLSYNPFPIVSSGYKFAAITTITNSTNFVISAEPTNAAILSNGVSVISWIDRSQPTGWIVRTATVIASSVASNLFTLTIDNPFVGMTVGDHIFPASNNGQNYLNTVLGSFGNLGPGQKTNNLALPTSLRKPLISSAFIDTVGGQFLKDLVAENTELESSDFSYQQYGSSEPSLPSLISEPPSIYTPNNISFYSF